MSPSDKSNDPHLSALREFLTPERLALVKKDPQRMAIAREISKTLARNPAFMKSVEALDAKYEAEFKKILSPADVESFGWESTELKRPSPAAAVAAAAVLAAAAPVPV
jgi:hypothetical protein